MTLRLYSQQGKGHFSPKISRNWILLTTLICKETNHVTGKVCKKTVLQTLTHINWNKLAILTGEGDGTPLQYSCLENPMDRGAWWAAVHGVATSQTRLSDFTFTFHFHALEKEMPTHSSVLAWRIPGMGEPGGLLSMGSHRVGHNWSDLAAAAAAAMP